jgi:steroid delta-isomerase-like uncharacterized protein
MSLEENKALVRRFVEEVQNQHNLAAIDELFSPDFVDHSGMAAPPYVEGTKELFIATFAAFPDFHIEIHQQLAEGDQVMTRKTLHGTHRGPFMGIPATGKEVAVTFVDIFTVINGKITEHWSEGAALGILQQLGGISTIKVP